MANSTDVIYAKALDCYVEIEYNENNEKLRSVRFARRSLKEKKTHDFTFELERYFNGEKIGFSCEIDISNLTPFTRKVLLETRKIEYGRTITYSELARRIGCRGARAIGRALSSNPVPIIIPCHRVIAKNGIGGYSGGIGIKTRLLELEKTNANNL